MAAASDSDLFIFGDNLEAILDALEENEVFEEDLSNVINDVSFCFVMHWFFVKKLV